MLTASQALTDATARAATFLLERQEPDGSFVDFDLDPGPSTSWTTAYVAVALSDALPALPASLQGDAQAAVERAAAVLLATQRPGGWGYNERVATDADSTAFAVRALLRAGHAVSGCLPALAAYVDERGEAHTFRGADQHGAWAGAHPDVTASVGLALMEARAMRPLRRTMLASALHGDAGDRPWTAYWWTQPCYGIALSLAWLAAEHARSDTARAGASDALRRLEGDLSAFDLAWLVRAEGLLAGTAHAAPVLLALQRADGGWPPSRALRLPAARPAAGLPSSCPVYADERRLFTTASALAALGTAAYSS